MRRRLRSSDSSAPRASSRARSTFAPFSLTRPARPSCALPDLLAVYLDRRHAQAGQPLDLVHDAIAERRRHLGEVQPVLDDDVEVDPDAVAVTADLDPATRAVAGQQAAEPARRHADDA